MSTTNDITELRTHLFDALRGLKDKTLDIDRAKAIVDMSQTIINTSKVEVEFLKVAGGTGSGFIPLTAPKPAAGDSSLVEQRPGLRVTQHKLRG
jgi:hypothetical protein